MTHKPITGNIISTVVYKPKMIISFNDNFVMFGLLIFILMLILLPTAIAKKVIKSVVSVHFHSTF